MFIHLEQYCNEEGRQNENFMQEFFIELLKKWKAEGKIRSDIDDEVILALFNSVGYLDTHKEKIGLNHFPQIIQLLIEFIMKGLTDCEK